MKKTKFRQCVLEKTPGHRIVSYIPEKFAKVGKVVKLKNDGEWDDGWVVKFAGDLVDEPPDIKKMVRVHRKRTGDSLPKPVT